jgi:hypothetical protein
MIKKTHTNINTNTKTTSKDKTKQKAQVQNSGSQRKRGRPNTAQPPNEQQLEELTNDVVNNQNQNQSNSELDPEMKEMYKLLDKFDATKLEKFNTVLSMYRQKPRMVNTITFKMNQDVNLDIEYYNIISPQQLDLLFTSDSVILTNGVANQQQQQQQLEASESNIPTGTESTLAPLERYRLILEYKDYNSRSELDRITKSYGARKFRNYVGNQVMEQFHKPLLGKLLNQFEELKQHVKYDSEEINLRFENFNFLGSTYIMMATLKYFVESGTMTMNRRNGYNAEVKITHMENPTFKITFKK